MSRSRRLEDLPHRRTVEAMVPATGWYAIYHCAECHGRLRVPVAVWALFTDPDGGCHAVSGIEALGEYLDWVSDGTTTDDEEERFVGYEWHPQGVESTCTCLKDIV